MAINSAVCLFKTSADGTNWTTVPAVGSATVSFSRPSMDITPIGDATSTYVAGTQSVSATLDIFYDQTNSAHFNMIDDINGAKVGRYYQLYLQSGETIHGVAFTTAFETTAQAGSVLRASVSLQFTGAVTVTSA